MPDIASEESWRGPRHILDWLGLRSPDDAPAEQFASWLPYSAYVPDEQLFINRNGCIGFVLEVLPQCGADDRMVEVLASLYTNCPAGTGIQFHLFGAPHVRDLLRDYANLRMEDADQYEKGSAYGRPTRNRNLYRVLARQRVEHLLAGTQRSLAAAHHFTLRDFRLLVSVTLPGRGGDEERLGLLCALRDSMAVTLASASLPNKRCDADGLINWCAQFTNPDRMTRTDLAPLHYDEGREVRDQIVDIDTIQDQTPDRLLFSKLSGGAPLAAHFLSIKSFPKHFHLSQMGSLIGDLMQPPLQYSAPFLLTMGVHILDHADTRGAVAANHFRANQNAASKLADVMPDVEQKRQDWEAAASAADAGGRLVSMYHQLGIFCAKERGPQAVETARAIWRARGFELNTDIFKQRQALQASLPMTLSPTFHDDLRKMRRVTRKTDANAIHLAPLIAEWRGTSTPALVLSGRRGQVTMLDLFDNDLGNYNGAVVGAPGSGKSVWLNELAWSYRSVGAKVWMMDLGRSFEKLCRKANGAYIEFDARSTININPFSVINDICEDMDMLVPAIAKMCSMKSQLEEVQYKAISAILLRLWQQYGRDMTMTAMRDAFKSGSIPDLGVQNDQRIRDLAIMLNPYSKDGQYARFFEGRNNVDFSNDLIVLENEELKRRPDLHAVVNILLMYQITAEMYLTRNRRKLLIMDELKQQLGEIGSDDPVKAAVVEEAARRARKYGGSLVTATQGADDYYGSAQMEAAFNCSDWMFLLRQKAESIELLGRKGRLLMDESKKRLLNSLRTEAGAYAEMYVSSPVGEGVVRLVLDPATHLLFSNKLEDNKPIDALRAQGYSIDEAINRVLADRRQA
ncbi:MAG: type IV secretion system protein TraC [Burkholderiaceae bacterium]|nr:type IV secretion system protein TraC [Burkholderiaceae bacterium]